MAPISKKRTEWLNLMKYLVLSSVFLSMVRPQIESASTQPNEYYDTVEVDKFRFQFPPVKSRFNYSEKEENPGRNGAGESINGTGGGVIIALHHNIHPAMINSTNSSKWMNTVLLESLERDKYRAKAISAVDSRYKKQLRTSTKVPLASGNPYGVNFIVTVAIGTPRTEKIKMNFDTASDVSWLQCNFRNGSSSYEGVTCTDSCNSEVDGISCDRPSNQCIYQIQRDDGGQLNAHMSHDILWLGARPFHKFMFGCGDDFSGISSNPSIGLLALGRNSLSLPSPMRSRYLRQFSYCLPDFLNPHETGSLRLGPGSIPFTSKFTALLSNPWAKSWYFVGLSGISVAGEHLNISPHVFQIRSGKGGTIIDSGVLTGRLVKPAYDALRAAFVKKMGLPLTPPDPQNPLDTCFCHSHDSKNLRIPGIAFHFQDGARLRIHRQGILTPISDSVVCLAFQAADDSEMSIIGTLQQQGYVISFDQYTHRIGFASVRTCNA